MKIWHLEILTPDFGDRPYTNSGSLNKNQFPFTKNPLTKLDFVKGIRVCVREITEIGCWDFKMPKIHEELL